MWKRGSPHAAGNTVNWYGYYRTVQRILEKLKTELPTDAAISLLGIHPKETKTLTQRESYMSTFIVTIMKTWKQPECPLMDE